MGTALNHGVRHHTMAGNGNDTINVVNTLFLVLTPIASIAGLWWHATQFGVTWVEPFLFVIWYFACGLSITVGYHRLFSHRSHEASWPLRLFYALFGAGAFENSALNWCADHRIHHRHTDKPEDPYSATRGFWWSHILWVMIDEGGERVHDLSQVKDLQEDPILRFQHKYYLLLCVGIGMLLPALVGGLISGVPGAVGGFVWAGLARTVFTHHGTFLINSAAHIWGTQPYGDANSSKDSPILAFLTFGEGYHNFHHTFQADYRNGHRWYHFDPSKWWIKAFAMIGLKQGLKSTPDWHIEDKRRQATFESAAIAAGSDEARDLTGLQERMKTARSNFKSQSRALDKLLVERRAARKERQAARRQELEDAIAKLREDIAAIRAEFAQIMSDLTSAKPMTA